MKRLMLAFAVISVSGCLCAKECKTAEDCPTGQVCGSQNLCEAAPSGGGAAGGAAGGGAGGTTAGGSAGGVTSGGGMAGGMAGGTAGGTAGGMAGGATSGGAAGGLTAGGMTAGGMTAGGAAGGGAGGAACGCAEFQECVSGQCVNATLTVLFPSEGMPHPAGAPLGVAARLTLSDGGQWPAGVEIPYVAGWGRSGVLPSDGGVVLVAVPANPTSRSIAIGWTDGGPGPVTRSVGFLTCEAAVEATCQPYQRCAPDADGGVCKGFEVVLAWVSPPTGFTRGPLMANVPVALTVAVDGGPMPAMVPVRFDGGILAMASRVGTTTSYTAPDIQFGTALAPVDGMQGLTAGWPLPGPSVTRAFTWDTTPPGLTTRVQGAPSRPGTWPNAGVWRKDEVVQVEVRSSEGLTAAASLVVPGTDGGAVARVGVNAACPFAGACAAARCDCFEVDMAQVPVNGVTGEVGLVLSGQDVVGNAAAAVDGGSILVTRVKWQTSVVGLTSPVDPALDTQGNVYVGGASGATSGVVAQVLRDGGVGWVQGGYGAVTAPVVWSPQASLGDAGVFVATKTTTQAQLRALDAVSGGAAGFDVCSIGGAATVYSARMVSLGATVVTARESGASQQQAYIADPASGNCNSNGTVFLTGKATLVGRGQGGGATEVFAASTGIGGFFRLTTNATGTNWAGTTDSLTGVSQVTGGLSLGGGRGFLTQAGAGTQGVLAHNLSTSAGSSTPAFAGSIINWTGANLGPSTTTIDAYFASPAGTTGGELYKTTLTLSSNSFSPSTQAGANRGAFSPTSNSFSPAHAPVLGQGGYVYTVSTNGDISVFSTGGVRQWAGVAAETQFGATSVAPLLDVARDGNGAPRCGRPGLLYVVSSAGVVTAFIVDSQGLDRTAAWPRFQHDNANSGNADTSLAGWGCP